MSRAPSLEADAAQLAAVLGGHKYPVLIVLTVLYFLGAVLHARSKPLWFDEIIATIAASSPDAATTWKVAQSVDASPPLPHLLMHFSIQRFGRNEIAIRLPSIAGFWLFCLALFQFSY